MFLAENFKYITIILSIIIFITLFIYNKKIAVIFDIIDNPKKNKIHKISTPLTAGFPILATFCILHIYYILYERNKSATFSKITRAVRCAYLSA